MSLLFARLSSGKIPPGFSSFASNMLVHFTRPKDILLRNELIAADKYWQKRGGLTTFAAQNNLLMHIDIITALPEILTSPLNESILKRAQKAGIVEIEVHNLRDYSRDKHKKVDDYAFSGGAGMVLQIEPVFHAINYLKEKRVYDDIIYTSPDGEKYNQKMANQLSTHKNIIILCGHYKGVDHRIREHLVTLEISVGDYVLTGGELAAAVIADSIVRLLPGAISDETSALTDSFQDNLLAPPVYTRPAEFNGWHVPEILLSGDTKKVEEWKMQKALERTNKLRPDLLNES